MSTFPQHVVLLVGGLAEEFEALRSSLAPVIELRQVAEPSEAAELLQLQRAPALLIVDFSDARAEWCARIRRDPATCLLPLLLLLGSEMSATDELRALQTGATDILPRPLNVALAALRIRNHLLLAQHEAELEARVSDRTRELSEAKLALEHENRAREKALARADFLANYDPLTALPNRRHLMERVAAEHGRVSTEGGSFALLLLNIDRFHVVNSALGNPVGDQLLVACAGRLEECLHRSDVLGRMGADEFMALLLGEGFDWHERAEQAQRVGRRMLAALATPFEVEGKRIEITASAGVAVFPGDGDTHTELYRRAAAALHQAKSSGRGALEGYRPEFDIGTSTQYRQEELIRQALQERGLRPYYQPKVELGSGRIIGAEALVRWPRAPDSVMGAAQIITLAQEANVLDAVEDDVLEKAFQQAAQWAPRLPAGFRIAVNLSPTRFRQQDLLLRLKKLLDRTRVRPDLIEVEITESALIEDLEGSVERMRSLRAMGMAISLDDFGTGYSSLSCMKLLPLDTIKIDQHFVREIDRDPRDAAIVRAVVTLAGSLGLATLVEGVETVAQLAAVREQGCRTAQGFLFSPPVPAADFELMLKRGALAPGRH